MVAHDVLKTKPEHAGTREQQEKWKQRWQEIHERQTSGIPGLLPLVLNLPVRFTTSFHADIRAQGVFKNARGWLRGWTLPPEEEERLAQVQEPEVVLRQMPARLWIEVPTGTNKMQLVNGKRIFELRVTAKQWTVDNAGLVKVLRYGDQRMARPA